MTQATIPSSTNSLSARVTSQCRRFLALVAHYPGQSAAIVLLVSLIGFSAVVIGCFSVAKSRLRASREALDQRKFPDALLAARGSLRLWPSAEGHFLAARAARYLNEYQEAEDHLQACERLEGRTEAISLERDMILAQRGALDSTVDQYLQNCIIQQHPDTLLILEALSQGYVKLFRFPQAVYCLGMWISRQPDSAEPLVQRGRVWEKIERPEAAETDYRQAVALDPDHFGANLNLAGLLGSRTRAAEAVPIYEKLRDQFPEDVRVLYGLGQCYLQLGRTEEAAQIFNSQAARYPEEDVALRERGQLAMDAGQLEEAEALLRRAIASDRFDNDSYFAMSLCLRRQGRSEEAKSYLEKSEQMKEWFNQLSDLTSKMASAPQDADLRFKAGQIIYAMGLEEEGVKWHLSALRENAEHEPTRRALAEHYEKSGRPDLAAGYRKPPVPGANPAADPPFMNGMWPRK
jgi:tetratricopeptide (TPR) repeat protein